MDFNSPFGYNQGMDMYGQDGMGMYGQSMNIYNQGMNMYNQGMDMCSQPRVNKATIIQAIQDYVVCCTQKPITQVIKIEEIDSKFRHACAEFGDVSFLDVNYFPVPQLGIQVAYYFCLSCGRLYIQKDFM